MSKSSSYLPTIGIECHVQLKTNSKLFSGAGNDARNASPNTLVNHIDFGLPGALPVLNKEALKLASRAALALKTKPQPFSAFDRKHYFYPDLPMGYQITQFDQPIIIGGKVEFIVDGGTKVVRITRAHLEADAGKSTHPTGADYSLVDLNRAGTPLLEIVSEPDMHSAADAKAYAKQLYLLMRYAGVTEGDLYHGNMRFDVNVSVSKSESLGTRSETKNLNSFRSVEKAIEYEIRRQIEILEGGGKIIQETRGWDDSKQKTISQRTKENADDYRYMPDPDLPPVILEESYIQNVIDTMPPSLDYWRGVLGELGVDGHQAEILIEANIEFAEARYLELLSAFHEQNLDAKQTANWIVNVDIPLAHGATDKLTGDRFRIYSMASALVQQNKLSSTNAKEFIVRLLKLPETPDELDEFAENEGLLQQSDKASIETIVDQVLAENEKAVSDVKAGEQKAIGFLVGQVMQRSQGKANPGIAKELISKKLGT